MEFPESFIYAGPAFSAPEQPVPAPYFRRQFRLERVPEQAEFLICGIGFYELYVNGQRITRGHLAPYISSPDVAVYYDSYDITPLLKIGENVLGVWLGNGFQNNPGGYVWDFDKARFRGAPRFALRLDECSGEKRQAILESDKAFLTAPSPLLSDDYRVGETYDARKERRTGCCRVRRPANGSLRSAPSVRAGNAFFARSNLLRSKRSCGLFPSERWTMDICTILARTTRACAVCM